MIILDERAYSKIVLRHLMLLIKYILCPILASTTYA